MFTVDSRINFEEVFNKEKFNSFAKLCRVTTYVLRFINNLKKRIEKKELIYDEEITIEEFEHAECIWLKFAQIELIKDNLKIYLSHFYFCKVSRSA